jgi:hypothetical protein
VHVVQVGVAFLLALEHANGLNVSPEENIELDRLVLDLLLLRMTEHKGILLQTSRWRQDFGVLGFVVSLKVKNQCWTVIVFFYMIWESIMRISHFFVTTRVCV